ncbi:MAG: hypothetical protein ABIH20_01560, partial [Candidatus Diapherotrites archaeon]
MVILPFRKSTSGSNGHGRHNGKPRNKRDKLVVIHELKPLSAKEKKRILFKLSKDFIKTAIG